MFGLSRLLKMAGSVAWRINGNWLKVSNQPARRTTLQLESLEDRLVPTLLGQNLFPADYAWNQNIANAPLASNSAAIMSHIGSGIGVHADWGESNPANGTAPLYGIPVNIVHGNTAPRVNVIIDNYPTESDIVSVPMPTNPIIEGDYQNGPNLHGPGYGTNERGDSHLLIWDQDNNIGYELYGVARPNDAHTFTGAATGGVWHAAQESVWDMKVNSFRSLGDTSADAAGLSILAGLVRPDEGLPTSQGGQGAINHALRFTLPSGDVNPQYMYPASHMVSTGASSTNVPFGARFRLRNDATTNAKIATLGPQAQIIAHAMQQYGLVLADIGAPMYVTGASATFNPNNGVNLVWNMTDALGLGNLKSGDFDVVDLKPRVTGLSSTSATPGTTISVFGQNFSGAAGQLSVFFGTVAASSVTVVSDSQLNVVVPNSSGTVHVQVQSGINAVDPNSQTHNVTAPIFGYGKSTATTVDTFTFGTGAPTISGTNSTASFAAPSVASGAGDVLTITVADTAGGAVSGLASSAFSLSLSGGSSTGTFSPVSASATPGTYSTTFTGALAGSTSTLTLTVAGVTFSIHPTILVTPVSITISGTNSTASFAAPSVASGAGDVLTITVVDTAGGAVSGLASSAFSLSLSGSSTGTFSPVSATATAGTYSTTFTGALAGSTSTLTVTVAGVTFSIHPTILVTPGSISAATSTATFASPTVTVGGVDVLTIRVKDSTGNPLSGLSGSAFSLSLAGGTSTGTFSSVAETATPGTYTASFTGVTLGSSNSLSVVVNGVLLSAHPTVAVTSASIFNDDFSSAGSNGQLNSWWTQQVGAFAVNTSAHTATGVGSMNLATVNNTSAADEAVFATVTLASGQSAGLVARYTGSGDRNMYMALVTAKSASYTVSLHRNINGSWAQLYAKSYTGTVSNATMEFDVVGSSLRVFLNGAIAAFASDTKLTGPGAVGMRVKGGTTISSYGSAPLTLANQTLPFVNFFSNPSANGQLSNAWLNRVGNISVVNQVAVGMGDVNLATVNGITAADVTVQADISVTAKGQNAGLVARYSGNGDQGMYYVRVAQTNNGTYNVALMVNVGGSWRTLKSQAISSGTGSLKLAISGNSMTVSWGGSALFTMTDASITAAGGVGMRLKGGAMADNFSVS